MSEPTPITDPYAYLNIVKNPDGSITRDLTKFPCTPATPDPSRLNPVVSKDVTVNKSKSTWMRLYAPNDAVPSQKLPLIIYYHGGGFVLCSADLQVFHAFCSDMSRDLNAIVASPSYRLAPEHRLPAAYDDGLEALEWIRNSGDEWIRSRADLSNAFLMGTSAGGNLAYNVAIRSAGSDLDLSPLRIRGMILHHPFFGGEERCGSEMRLASDQVCPPIVSDVFWDLCLPVGVDRDHEYSNPTAGDGSGGLEKIGGLRWKVMVVGGEEDPMVDRQRDVAKLMRRKGVEVVEVFNDGDFHGAEIGDPSKRKPLFVSIGKIISSVVL